MSRPFIPVPHCASFELIYGCVGQVLENVMHVQKDSDFTLAQLTALRTIVNQWDIDSWASRRPSGVVLNRIRTKALHAPDAPLEDYALPTPRAGSFAGTLLPLSCTFCVKLASAVAGRSQRGRLFFPGITTTMQQNTNQMLAAQADAIVASLNLLRDRLAAASPALTWVVVSYRADKIWRAEGKPTPITQAVYVDLNLDNQRRRLTGRGRT